MHKEAALERYKISISYENYSFEEIMELYAEGPDAAAARCEFIKSSNRDLVEHLSRSNVFVSKVIKEVKILPDGV